MSLCALLGALGHRVFSQKKVLSLSIPPVINMASMAGAASSAALTMVHVWVTPEKVEEFKAASLANHAESIKVNAVEMLGRMFACCCLLV